MKQGTQEWKSARIGKITGSRYPAIAGLNPYKSRADVLREMVREAYGEEPEFTGNEATRWGNTHEPIARREYQDVTGDIVEEVGVLVNSHNKSFACSPDGIIGDRKLLEIKCPYSRIIPDQSPLYYKEQVRWNLFVTERKFGLLFYWTPTHNDLRDISQWTKGETAVAIKIATDFLVDYKKALDNPTPHLEPLVEERTDAQWQEAATRYFMLKRTAEGAVDEMGKARQRLLDLAGGRNSKGFGARVEYYQRRGSVNWSGFKKDRGILDAELESYRTKSATIARIVQDED